MPIRDIYRMSRLDEITLEHLPYLRLCEKASRDEVKRKRNAFLQLVLLFFKISRSSVFFQIEFSDLFTPVHVTSRFLCESVKVLLSENI